MASWRSGVSALGSRSGVRRVLIAYAAFGLLEFYVWLVVVLWAFAVGGATLAGVAALVQLLPAAVMAPPLASLGDRLPRGSALVLAYLLVTAGAALTWLALASHAPVPVVLACAVTLTTTIAAARPVHFAALPELARAEPEQLVSATSLSSVIDGTVRFAGPLLAGAVVAASGVGSAMLAGIGLGLISTALCVNLGLPRSSAVEAGEDVSTVRAALAGLGVLRASPASLVLLVFMSLDFVLTGAVDILGVAYAESSIGDGGAAAGLVVGAMGIGALIGAVVSGGLAQGRRLLGAIVGGAVVEGLLFASIAAWDRLVPVVIVLAAAGIGGAVTIVAGRTLLQRTTDDQVLARVFALQESASLLGLALGAILAPALIHSVGVQYAWLPLGLAVAAVGALGIAPIGVLDRRARWLPQELRLLRGVPFIGALPPYGLERLAQETRWVTFRAGDVIGSAGDEGDQMYIVGDGELSAWSRGERRPGVLGPGRWFGSATMLRGMPRAATVVGETHGRLLEVTRSAFVHAAGGDDREELVLHSRLDPEEMST